METDKNTDLYKSIKILGKKNHNQLELKEVQRQISVLLSKEQRTCDEDFELSQLRLKSKLLTKDIEKARAILSMVKELYGSEAKEIVVMATVEKLHPEYLAMKEMVDAETLRKWVEKWLLVATEKVGRLENGN
mgnify:FL=1